MTDTMQQGEGGLDNATSYGWEEDDVAHGVPSGVDYGRWTVEGNKETACCNLRRVPWSAAPALALVIP